MATSPLQIWRAYIFRAPLWILASSGSSKKKFFAWELSCKVHFSLDGDLYCLWLVVQHHPYVVLERRTHLFKLQDILPLYKTSFTSSNTIFARLSCPMEIGMVSAKGSRSGPNPGAMSLGVNCYVCCGAGVAIWLRHLWTAAFVEGVISSKAFYRKESPFWLCGDVISEFQSRTLRS